MGLRRDGRTHHGDGRGGQINQPIELKAMSRAFKPIGQRVQALDRNLFLEGVDADVLADQFDPAKAIGEAYLLDDCTLAAFALDSLDLDAGNETLPPNFRPFVNGLEIARFAVEDIGDVGVDLSREPQKHELSINLCLLRPIDFPGIDRGDDARIAEKPGTGRIRSLFRISRADRSTRRV